MWAATAIVTVTLLGVLATPPTFVVRPPAPALAANVAAPGPAMTWTANLAAGEAAGVALTAGAARLDPASAFLAPVEDPGPAGAEGTPAAAQPPAPDAVPTGLLTLPAQLLDRAALQVTASIAGSVPAGSTASVDIRGRGSSGRWSEWIPSAGGAASTVTLPEPATEVQGRLVLTGPATGSPDAGPAVSGLTLSAQPAPPDLAEAKPATGKPLRYRIFATREGLVGRTTANGHRIKKRDRFVALPSRRALSPRNSTDYRVRVCAANGRCVTAPVWDVGPWNTRDDYWNPAAKRQEWRDLPQGMPAAQAAREKGYNGGKDQFRRKVSNPAGIDLADGVFWDALGLKDNSWVQVEYLWTGPTTSPDVITTTPYNPRP